MAFLLTLALAAQDGRALELFDVRDLAVPVRDYPLSGPRPAGAPPALDAICRMLVSSHSSVELDGDLLKVKATADEHEAVRRMIDLLRSRTRFLVAVDVRLVRRAEAPGEAEGPARAEVLSEADLQGLLKKTAIVTAPRITAFSGQLSHVGVASQSAYIGDYDVTVGKNGTVAAPIFSIAESGIRFALRPVVARAEKNEVLLEDVEIAFTRPRQEAFRAIETPYGTIKDPELMTRKYSVSPRLLKKGEALLIGPMSEPWAAKDAPGLWALVACRITDASEEAPKKR